METRPVRLDAFNAMPDAVGELTACCASPGWARAVADARPYPSVDALVEHAATVLAGLDEDEIDLALAGHPRIGERSAHASAQREQSGVTDADRAALAEANRAYQQRFGHVYLVCADGRPAAYLLDILHTRLHHTPTQERATLRAELNELNTLRLRRLVDTSEPERGSDPPPEGVVAPKCRLSTHVLDVGLGRPAAGVAVTITFPDGTVRDGVTDEDGRVDPIADGALPGGTYRLRFDTGAYFAGTGQAGFHPEVVVAVGIDADRPHTHVPLLLSPYSYTTYRGS